MQTHSSKQASASSERDSAGTDFFLLLAPPAPPEPLLAFPLLPLASPVFIAAAAAFASPELFPSASLFFVVHGQTVPAILRRVKAGDETKIKDYRRLNSERDRLRTGTKKYRRSRKLHGKKSIKEGVTALAACQVKHSGAGKKKEKGAVVRR